MSDDSKMFVYVDSRGTISARAVVRVSESEGYIQGMCLMDDAFRTFRKDRVLEYVQDEGQLQSRLEHWQKPEKAEDVANQLANSRFSIGGNGLRPRAKKPDNAIEVCFTGFKAADKDRLATIASDAGMTVRTSVTTFLDFLCCGYNAGPKKIDKARHQGVVTLSEGQFIALVETGEIPEAGLNLTSGE